MFGHPGAAVACQCCYPGDPLGGMQPADAYGNMPMDLHVSAQGYHPYYSILEMRKEKSRDAARSRRGKENYEFYELAKLLPLPAAITTQLDKASIIRLSISYLKLRDFTAHGDPPWNRDSPSNSKAMKGSSLRSRSGSSIAMDLFEQHQGTHILQSLDGFAFALSADGRFLYISETVSIYLGLSQVEMTGSSIFDYIHQQDHAELAEQIGINLAQQQTTMASSPGSVASDDGSSSSTPGGTSTPTGLDRQIPVMTLNSNTPYKGMDRSFCIRMKSTLTKRGCHFKSSGYRVVLVLSHMRPQYNFSGRKQQGAGAGPQTVMGMVAMAIALPPPSINEVRLESDMFVTRLTFEFRIAHCEPRVSDLLDYTADELTGKNMYTLCHGQDVQKLRKCHVDLINKGQVMSSYYRLINKNGGYTWVQTCATVICNSKNSDEQSIICVNYIISGIEYENCILDCSQMPNSGNLKPDDPSNSERGSSPEADPREEGSSREGCCTPKTDGGRCSSSTAGGDSDHHISHLVKHSNVLRPPGERCSLQDDVSVASNGYDMEPKQLDLSVDINRYQETVKHSSHHPCIDSQPHGRVKKRRLISNGHQINYSDTSMSNGDRKSPPDNVVSSLNATSPLDNGGTLVDRVTPDRTGLNTSSDGICHRPTTPPSSGDSDKIDRPWKRSPSNSSSARNAYNSSNGSAMSVKELEDVMNKHLPSAQDGHDPLGKVNGNQQQRSTIQWIGAPQTTLPASSLLRQIYVNRESVIRSGTHISRPTYYGESQGPLPTPPGSGGSGEAYPDQNQFMIPSKMSAESYGVIAGYSTAPATVTSYMDTYSAMTPPASVSPRDKFHPGISDTAAFSEAAAAAAAAAIPHMHHYVSDGTLQHLPLKPQVFVHPGTLDPAAYGHSQQGLSPEQQQQLYAHHASGFHLYHPSSSSKTSHHTANGSSWYPQPNT
ncbi:protein trachealess isoform X1 [Parasteatoda tepidariorum]|uniref:protein trachealess isoform X1 n=1 Tax=Parasteatoda tepidariorum TaxID=114398 RepID=UPI001C726C85|nr:protein trachealess isoform X2 [Parasteatoda tepidariorum]